MTSTTTERPQLLLPGQAAAPPGPIDMTVMYVMHHGFRRDLERFAAAVPATPVDDLGTWSALASRWALTSRVLHHHHTAEDAGVWPVLLDRADPVEAAALRAMEEEHDRLDPALAAVSDGLDLLARDRRPDAEHVRAALTTDLAVARRLLGDHLAHEEREAIGIVQRHLTPAEWADIERRHFRSRPAPASIRFLVPWFLEDVPQHQITAVLASVGGPVALLWRLTRRSFRRGERRAFRYAGLPSAVPSTGTTS